MMDQTESSDSVRIEIEGDLLGFSALSLPSRLPLADLAAAKSVLVSMENVRHMDQAGLAMLVRLYSQLRVRGSELLLVDVPGPVLQTLERVGLAGLVSSTSGSGHEHEVERRQESVVGTAQPET
jgi:anti-anti-sigma factor